MMYIAEKTEEMYLKGKMSEAAYYKTVVEFIRWALKEQGISVQDWVQAQPDRIISIQGMYDILNYKSEAKYTLIYEIATRLGAEININLPYPPDAKK